jgi:hypothetical protein
MPRLKVKTAKTLPIIGWKEHVWLPDLQIGKFVAKIDTGATYCALHATEIEVRHGMVSFRFEDGDVVRAELAGRKRIVSSNGHSDSRPLIHTRVKIGQKLIHTEVTLIDRSTMKDKMLIGRKFLSGRFLVDPKRSLILSVKKKKRKTT